jgi:hypothetical protein
MPAIVAPIASIIIFGSDDGLPAVRQPWPALFRLTDRTRHARTGAIVMRPSECQDGFRTPTHRCSRVRLRLRGPRPRRIHRGIVSAGGPDPYTVFIVTTALIGAIAHVVCASTGYCGTSPREALADLWPTSPRPRARSAALCSKRPTKRGMPAAARWLTSRTFGPSPCTRSAAPRFRRVSEGRRRPACPRLNHEPNKPATAGMEMSSARKPPRSRAFISTSEMVTVTG